MGKSAGYVGGPVFIVKKGKRKVCHMTGPKRLDVEREKRKAKEMKRNLKFFAFTEVLLTPGVKTSALLLWQVCLRTAKRKETSSFESLWS